MALINLATASGLAIVLRKQKRWTKRIQALVQIPLIILLMSATLFPILATRDKATDRMSYVAPHTLDGMEYMQSSFFSIWMAYRWICRKTIGRLNGCRKM